MLKLKFNIKREIKIVSAALLVCVLIGFSERRRDGIAVQEVQIKLNNIADNHFLDEKDVINLMQMNQENLRGAKIESLDMGSLEQKIRQERFVRDADLYSDLSGNLIVNVTLQRPIARFVRNDGPDGYIAEDGTIMPVPDKFASRVILISGNYVSKFMKGESVVDDEIGSNLLETLERIRADDFLRAQIAEMDIDSRGKVTLYPQVGGQLIEFGRLVDVEDKFKRLRVFYKQILPVKGWNTYSRINLEYEGQIIAE